MAHYLVALDQGTTSTRALVFSAAGSVVGSAQREHEQFFDAPGWVAHDPEEIWRNTRTVIDEAIGSSGISPSQVAALGITNQRETAVVWDRRTGAPAHPAIVWQDTRTQSIIDDLAADGGAMRFAETTGLPLATYFTASKVRWILDSDPALRKRAAAGELAMGTIDSWLIWKLSGGPTGGVHVTDVTNASRTMLMDLSTLDWSDELLAAFDIPRAMLPSIRPSVGHFATVADASVLRGVPIMGVLGDQQSATFGQAAFAEGESKNTYGTGNFLIVNTGERIVRSQHGLLTTVAYQLEGESARFALEGSVAVTGSLVQWLRDNLGVIATSGDIEPLAASVPDNGDVYFVPAFSGLFAPYWRPDARGAIVGLTRFANRGHLARAALESTAFQTCDVVDALRADLGMPLPSLRVDGGMVGNEWLMQFQADLLGMPLLRPAVTETTALGAAFAAGLAAGLWSGLDELSTLWREDRRWVPQMTEADRVRLRGRWSQAIDRSLDWVH